jgi:cob(I)alamin adenosyltransferase
MPIYTKFGDRGATRLFDGSRVTKSHDRVAAYGEVDELNSTLGVALAETLPSDIRDLLVRIQGHLMSVGASLANPDGDRAKAKSRPDAAWIGELEAAIDRYDAEPPALRRFILPGGSRAAAALHMARTTCRRAERRVVELSESTGVDTVVLGYINRLSDLLFVLARVANHREGIEETQW